jgi:hypothetical protein
VVGGREIIAVQRFGAALSVVKDRRHRDQTATTAVSAQAIN